ncbi:TonB-dependent receptor [Croceicoccus sp. F390]|uniref:TonB-dependent receptor n=1 Tax=Croceicoccus esteveae TaxID=3075597 RepID=A0ABU2ZIC8_9SPHN|nr:TonB-dependent receptor [Croceicoccus sp. F390]MDT0575162.1 TonB-dependent receptor [Croceicoccus sp. F390]
MKHTFQSMLKTGSSLRAVAVTGVSLIAFAAHPALAQGQPTQENLQENRAAPADSGLIIVTGSRIARPTVESTAPLQIIDDAVIDESGATNIQEVLLENPVFGTPALSRTNSAFLTSGTGVATVDLRNLGSDRTLVLINGRRVVSSLPGSATVDLNVIPTQFVERIDILTGGASSLYGSDAVAGVVNFVYKQNFNGIEANGQYGLTEEGDDIRYQANLTAGTDVADGNGNIMVHFGYSNEKGLYSRQRKNTRVDDYDKFAFTGDPADFGTSIAPFFSSFPPQGRFITSGGTFTYDANNNLQAGFSTNGPDVDGDGFGDGGPLANGFNRQQFRTLAVPVERYTFAAAGDYGLTDTINVFFEGTFNKTSSSRIIEPFPLESGGPNGVFPSGGGYNIENFVTRATAAGGQERVIAANPFVPDAILNAATDSNGDGLRDIGFARRLSDFGPRSGTTERDFYRFVVGFDGTIADERFRWDASYNYGQVNENQISSGQVNVVNFRDALAVQQDFDDVNGNGSTEDLICVNAEARANGCVPANIFGAGSLSPEAVAYIQAQGTFQTGIKQHVAQANLSGSLLELPAGPLGVAVGAEYRKEEAFEDSDALTNAGLNAGNKIPDTRGSFDVIEGFAEVSVPILADTPFFELLEVGGAVRVAKYSTVGTTFSYNGTVAWQPIEDVRVRGTYARSVRAPNVAELFSGLSQTFPSGITDPCVGVGLTGGGALGDNCRAAPGVLDNIRNNGGSFTINQADLQGISGFNGGNPDLNEEKADSYTAGVVINPRSITALRNLTLTADYYNIKIEDVIAAFPRQFTLSQCYEQGNDTFCDLITRRPTGTAVNSAGSIDLINALSVNAAILKTEGVDVTANWTTGLGFIGDDRLALRVAYNHVIKNDYTPLAGEDVDPSAGEIGDAKDSFTANVTYSNDDVRIGFTGTWIGKSYEDDQFCAAYDLDPKCISVPAQFYLDMQTTFLVDDHFEFYVGADNLLDNNAPNLLSGTSFNVTGSDTAADVYDIFGRRFYAGARVRF